jgi:hypothetical protein
VESVEGQSLAEPWERTREERLHGCLLCSDLKSSCFATHNLQLQGETI